MTKYKSINVVKNIVRDLLQRAVDGFFKFYAMKYVINDQFVDRIVRQWLQRPSDVKSESTSTSKQKRFNIFQMFLLNFDYNHKITINRQMNYQKIFYFFTVLKKVQHQTTKKLLRQTSRKLNYPEQKLQLKYLKKKSTASRKCAKYSPRTICTKKSLLNTYMLYLQFMRQRR